MTTLKKYWLLPAFLLAAAVCFWIAVRIVNSIDYHNNDFFTFWLAGHLVTQGGNPYSPDDWVAGHHQFEVTWIPNQAYVYPLPLSLLFAPLGWLPLKQAYIVWVTLSGLMILAGLLLLVLNRPDIRTSKIFLPLLVGSVFFRPVILTLFNGQISGWLFLLLAGTIILWQKGKWEWGSLLLPLLMLKPNLGAPMLVLIGLWLLIKKRYRSILVIVTGLLVLLLIGFLQNPHWVADYWSIGNLKVEQNFGGSPTLWGLSYLVCQRKTACTTALGGAVSLVLTAAFLWLILVRWKDILPLTLVALAATVTLLITPYTWTYDQILLLLLIVDLTLEMERNKWKFVLVSSWFLGLDFLFLLLLVFDTLLQVEIFNAIVPLVLLGIVEMIYKQRKTKTLASIVG
jgi:hypothetical protein